VTVSLSAHTTLSRHQSRHITDVAGHQQTQLLMLVISLVTCVGCGSMAFHSHARRWRPAWVEYDIVHVRMSHSCIAHRHRPHSQQQLHEHT